jgi:hypothetical protein
MSLNFPLVRRIGSLRVSQHSRGFRCFLRRFDVYPALRQVQSGLHDSTKREACSADDEGVDNALERRSAAQQSRAGNSRPFRSKSRTARATPPDSERSSRRPDDHPGWVAPRVPVAESRPMIGFVPMDRYFCHNRAEVWIPIFKIPCDINDQFFSCCMV